MGETLLEVASRARSKLGRPAEPRIDRRSCCTWKRSWTFDTGAKAELLRRSRRHPLARVASPSDAGLRPLRGSRVVC